MTVIKDGELEGKRVILEDASDVGTLVELYVDSDDWRITRFDLKLEKKYAERLGVESGLLKKALIPIKIHNVKSVGDVVHLKGSIEDLKRSQKTVLPSLAVEPKAPAKAEAVKKAPDTAPTKTKPPRTRPAHEAGKPRKI